MKVINAISAHVRAGLEKGEPVKLGGLGTFLARPAREEGKPRRILFRPAAPKEEKKGGKGRQAGNASGGP
jgi:hypothetical protein